MLPYGRQDIQEEDVQAVVEVLRHQYLTQGQQVPALEKALAEYTGTPWVTLVNSATSALHLGCLALGVEQGDRVWTSPLSFVASANCARYCGAEVDFVDIDPSTLNLSLPALANKLAWAASLGRLPKLLIVVHFAGLSADMAEIKALCERYQVRLMEDASHALGGRYQGMPVGALQHADLCVFSFHPVKMITTGEGGAILCRDPELHQRIQRLRSHGIDKDSKLQEQEGGWYYQQQELGFNYRMTDLQAALGLSQLSRLDGYVQQRQALAERYDQQLQGLPLQLPPRVDYAESSWHLYVVQLQDPMQRRPLYDFLQVQGVAVQVHYIPIHWQPYYQRLGFARGDFPAVEDYYQRTLTLPLFPTLTNVQQDRVIALLHSFLSPD
ncbi:UDP-4-amino-4,6-dideoxy-N-acetyl-beta-L-altrosamine transaminase [Balneatrix alpica]|uniref:UDP-4-amino-4, 6-dideoxy-N-acetyl-beta-L-altrosamine transaminase n=1 Tax=Balneatrix alpica TaxID=75684 RepID=A0ABV5ZEH7_9GAMM|nr:UDP-4-amino-4,6-dideoxy-N-acetyl-beta-L-altrosamine transaminase [Balneatrix alpica]